MQALSGLFPSKPKIFTPVSKQRLGKVEPAKMGTEFGKLATTFFEPLLLNHLEKWLQINWPMDKLELMNFE